MVCNRIRLFLIEVQSLSLVLLVIVRQHAEECCNLVDGMFGIGADVLVLKPQHHHAIEGVEASLYLAQVLVSTVAKLDYERQHLVVFGSVERKLRGLQQLCVQLGKVLNNNLVYLQVSLLAASLLVYHSYQVAPPVQLLFLLLVVKFE